MAKEITKVIKLQIPAGKATPAPPVGTILGPVGINLQEFCTRFNDATKDKMGDILPVEISIYNDRSFDFVLKTPPAAFLLKKIAKIKKGSSKGANEMVAVVTEDQIKEIAEIKMVDLNAYDIEAAMKIIEGTARNMGIAVKGVNDEEMAHQAEEAAEAEKEMARREAELEKAESDVVEAKAAEAAEAAEVAEEETEPETEEQSQEEEKSDTQE